MYYSLRFVLPNGEVQVQRNSTGREDRECHSPGINPLHVMKTFQMTKNGPQKPSQLNLIQVGNKGRKRGALQKPVSIKMFCFLVLFKAKTEEKQNHSNKLPCVDNVTGIC